MKLIVPSGDLRDAVEWAGRALARTPANPVLAGLRIAAHAGGRVEVRGHDYDLTARGVTTGDVGEPGACLVPGWILGKVLAGLPRNEPLEILTSGTEAVLSCAAATCTLHIIPEQDFPAMPATGVPLARANAGELQQMLHAIGLTLSDASTVDPSFHGGRMCVRGTNLSLTGSDGYALITTEMEVERPEGCPPEVGFTIPLRSVAAFSAGIATGDQYVDLAVDDRKSDLGEPFPGVLSWSNPVRSGATRGVDARYKEWHALFEPEPVATVTVEVAPLVAAMKLAAAMSAKGDPAVRVTFSQQEARVEGGLDEDSLGRTQDVLPAQYTGTGERPVMIRQDYLEAVLLGAGSDRAVISFTGRPPLVVTPAGEGGTPGYRAMVAPRAAVRPR